MKRLFTTMYEVDSPLWWAVYRLKKIFVYPLHGFFHWLWKSIQYANFLRNDHDWDYIFILRLLRYKLLRTAHQINDNQIIEEHQRVYNDIVNLVVILDRIIEDNYFTPEMRDLLERSDPLSRRPPGLKPLSKSERKRLGILLKRREEAKERDFRLFFDTLRLKIRSFWD